MDCGQPASSVHEILQARILEWVAISSSRVSSLARNQICVSCIGRWILYCRAMREARYPCYGEVKLKFKEVLKLTEGVMSDPRAKIQAYILQTSKSYAVKYAILMS